MSYSLSIAAGAVTLDVHQYVGARDTYKLDHPATLLYRRRKLLSHGSHMFGHLERSFIVTIETLQRRLHPLQDCLLGTICIFLTVSAAILLRFIGVPENPFLVRQTGVQSGSDHFPVSSILLSESK